MKKLFISAIAMMVCAMSANAELKPATFENEDGGIQLSAETPVWRGYPVEDEEESLWKSGDFTFTTTIDDWGEYGVYYYDITASNLQNTTFSWSNPYFDQYAAAGKAAEGNNYAVWYYSWYGPANVTLEEAQVLSGMAVTNNTYLVDAVLNGDGMSEEEGGKGLPFHAGDYYKLTITGYLNEEATGEVEFYLADFRATEASAKWYYAENWQWIDLTSLGTVDAIGFAVESTKSNTQGSTTPSYFCFDNLGGDKQDCELGAMTEIEVKATAVENTVATVSAQKAIRDGQLLIIRDGKTFNAQGVVLR